MPIIGTSVRSGGSPEASSLGAACLSGEPGEGVFSVPPFVGSGPFSEGTQPESNTKRQRIDDIIAVFFIYLCPPKIFFVDKTN